MTQSINTIISHVLAGITEDGSNYNARVMLISEKITNKVIEQLESSEQLYNIIGMVSRYQNDKTLTSEQLESLYTKTDELTFSALRQVMPSVDDIQEWYGKTFFKMLENL